MRNIRLWTYKQKWRNYERRVIIGIKVKDRSNTSGLAVIWATTVRVSFFSPENNLVIKITELFFRWRHEKIEKTRTIITEIIVEPRGDGLTRKNGIKRVWTGWNALWVIRAPVKGLGGGTAWWNAGWANGKLANFHAKEKVPSCAQFTADFFDHFISVRSWPNLFLSTSGPLKFIINIFSNLFFKLLYI